MVSFLILLSAAIAAPSSGVAPPSDCEADSHWRLLLVNGPDGEALMGSRQDLIRAMRRGSPVRVSWGEAAADGSWSVEEFANATFVNVIGNEVVAQIEPALIQSSYTDAAKAGLKSPPTDWLASVSTTGRFDAIMVDRRTGAERRVLVQRTQIAWYALAPEPACDRRPLPPALRPGQTNRIESDLRHPD